MNPKVQNARCTHRLIFPRDDSFPRQCEKREGHKGAHTFGIEHPDRLVVSRVRYPRDGEPFEEIIEVLS